MRIFKLAITSILLNCIFWGLMGCAVLRKVNPFPPAPVQVQAYRIIVGAKAFIDSVKKNHQECNQTNVGVCDNIHRAIAAKDTLIDLTEVYCASPAFESGGPCTPPQDQTVKQAYQDKLVAAIQIYEQTESDLRAALKGSK